MQPCARIRTEVGDRRDGIDRGGRRGADGRDHSRGVGQVERVRAKPEVAVGRRLPELEPEQLGCFVDGRVRVLRADDHVPACCLAGRRERGDCRSRRGVLDVTVPASREPEQLRNPVQRHLLELSRRRRGPPEEGDGVEGRGEQLREDPRLRGADREVREEARALPVRDARQQDLVEVAQHVRERLALLRRRDRQGSADVTGLDLCEDGQLADALEIPRRPLERGSAVLAEAHLPSFAI